MKKILFFLFCLQISVVQSQRIEANFIEKITLKADRFIGVDTFSNYYYVIGTTLYKRSANKTYAYNNTALGSIYTVDLSNPLKIVLFYRDFNTVIILDNRLNALTDSINFSIEAFNKNVTSVSMSSTNNLWLYSLDDNIVSLWNYETKKTIFNSQPLSFYEENFEASEQISSYESCWLISKGTVLKFNEYGSYVDMRSFSNAEKIVPYLDGFFYLKHANMYYNETSELKVVFNNRHEHEFDHFYVTKNYLYFFDANVLYKYGVLKK